MARVQANETLFEIFYQNASNPLRMVQSSCFGRFRTIWLLQAHRCKIESWDAVWARVWANETIVEFYSQNTTLGPKLMFWVVSHHLVAASAPLQNGALECRLGTSSG